MNFKKRTISIILVLGILIQTTTALAAGISSKGGFVLNASTGQEVLSYNGDKSLVPASMTKVMAVYVIYDAMAKGLIHKETEITISPALASFSRKAGYSNVPLKSGESYTLDELLGVIFVVSANAAVMAVGDHLFGSEEAFVNRMNQFINDWGLEGHFKDCTGVSAQNKVTPRAMASIANRLIQDYPDCLNYTGLSSVNFRGTTYGSTNNMLSGRSYAYEGTLGLKTGTTSAAGACFTGVVERDGVRLISVIMGAPYSNCRYTDTISMLNEAFEKVKYMPAPEPVDEYPEGPVPVTVYVNDMPIPGFELKDQDTKLIRVEDLRENGFDVEYEEDTNTLVVVNKPEKEMNGHNIDDFPRFKTVSKEHSVKVVLKENDNAIGLYVSNVYDAQGQAAIDVKELSYLGWVIQKNGKATIVTR